MKSRSCGFWASHWPHRARRTPVSWGKTKRLRRGEGSKDSSIPLFLQGREKPGQWVERVLKRVSQLGTLSHQAGLERHTEGGVFLLKQDFLTWRITAVKNDGGGTRASAAAQCSSVYLTRFGLMGDIKSRFWEKASLDSGLKDKSQTSKFVVL